MSKWPSLTLQDSSRRLFYPLLFNRAGRSGREAEVTARPRRGRRRGRHLSRPRASECQRGSLGAPRVRARRRVGRAGDLPIVASRPHTHFIYFPAGKAPRRSVGARSGRLSGRGSASTGAASATAVGARVSRDGEPRVRTRLGRRSRNPAPRVEEARISDRPGVAVRVGQGAVENEGQLAQRQHG